MFRSQLRKRKRPQKRWQMVMLIIQYDCRRGYKSIVMALKTALDIDAEIIMLQEPFIGN